MGSSGKMAQRSVPAPFLTKTYQLVEDPETNDVVSWNENGTAFVVWKMADFARDLLPKYFKHNNFSSFVRQLNTYGFRKVVPDKWEFANENFRRGQRELLTDIRRRKAAAVSSAQPEKPAGENSLTPSNSGGDDLGSTSTSSKSPGSVETAAVAAAAGGPAQFADLSGENEKLKKDNEVLSSELAQTKRQCEELIAFLTKYVKVGPDQIDRIMREGRVLINGCDGAGVVEDGDHDHHDHDRDHDDGVDDEEKEEEEKEGLKLFGVWVNNKKRKIGIGGPHRRRKMKGAVDFQAPPLMI